MYLLESMISVSELTSCLKLDDQDLKGVFKNSITYFLDMVFIMKKSHKNVTEYYFKLLNHFDRNDK